MFGAVSNRTVRDQYYIRGSYALKKDIEYSSETLVPTDEFTRLHNSEQQNDKFNSRINFRNVQNIPLCCLLFKQLKSKI
jgi:hypothetical protein